MVDVEPGFYKGVDRYEQACKMKLMITLMNDKVIVVPSSLHVTMMMITCYGVIRNLV